MDSLVDGSSDSSAWDERIGEVLCDPHTYARWTQPQSASPSALPEVRHISTYCADIYLVGEELAFKKQKRASYPFMDLATLDKRRVATHKEYTLNSRSFPQLYRGVVVLVAIVEASKNTSNQDKCSSNNHNNNNNDNERENERAVSPSTASLALIPDSEVDTTRHIPIAYLVRMLQFEERNILNEVAERGELTQRMLHDVVSEAVALHNIAKPHPDPKHGAQYMQWVCKDNLEELREHAHDGRINADLVERVCGECVSLSEKCAQLLDDRVGEGKVRYCHGDLHLKNIVVFDGHPRLFDCIAFNDDLAISDVLYDLAFLLMDLLHCGLKVLANYTMNRYIELTNDVHGLPLLPLFLAARALVRCKIACTTVKFAADSQDEAKLKQSALSYLKLAESLVLHGERPVVVAVGGFSGSGKTSVGRSLATKLPGAIGGVQLRSDVTRKHMFNMCLTDRIPPEEYTWENQRKCYVELLAIADQVSQTFSVVIDATFSTKNARELLVEVSQQQPQLSVWIDVPFEERVGRLQQRDKHQNDASDMTAEKLASIGQQSTAPCDSEEWVFVPNTHNSVENAADIIVNMLKTTTTK